MLDDEVFVLGPELPRSCSVLLPGADVLGPLPRMLSDPWPDTGLLPLQVCEPGVELLVLELPDPVTLLAASRT